MQIIIDSKNALDQHATKVAKFTKLSPNALKTAIAKAYGHDHITAFTQALKAADAPKPAPQATSIPYPLEQLVLWLEDNVNMGTDIHFDNDGEITSEEALPALTQMLAQAAPLDMDDIAKQQDDLNRFDAKASCMAAADVASDNELSLEHWEQAEEALETEAKNLASQPSLAHALAILKLHDLDDVAQAITNLTVTSKDLTYLKDTV